jgi:hypothetical protein
MSISNLQEPYAVTDKTNVLKPGKYKHFKGNEYEVIDVALHSETLEEMVIYRPLYGEGKIWVRPLSMFLDMKEIEGKSVPRFELLELR